MKNKKGVMFAVAIMITALILLVLAFYCAFTNSNIRADKLTNPLGFLNIREEAREAHFYVQESANLASQQAAFDLLQELPLSGQCSAISTGETLFNDDCSLDSAALQDKYLQYFGSAFTSYLQDYKSTYKIMPNQQGLLPEMFSGIISTRNVDNYDYELTGPKLAGKPKAKLSYPQPPVDYKIDPSFDAELPFAVLEIDTIYKASKSAADTCKEESDALTCASDEISKQTFDFFDIDTAKQDDYLVVTATTKEKFFFKETRMVFDKARMNFAFPLS